jgi:hypothetical protein
LNRNSALLFTGVYDTGNGDLKFGVGSYLYFAYTSGFFLPVSTKQAMQGK